MSTARLLLLSALLVACGEKEHSDDSHDHGDDSAADDSGASDDSASASDEEYGPDNDWDHALESEVPDGLEGTGWRVGDTAYNFTLQDQFGNEVELYQFYGKVIVLDLFAMWCGPCQQFAPDGEDIWTELEDRGLVYLAVMQENTSGGAPTTQDALDWGAAYNLTHPILLDVDGTQGQYVNIGGGYPTFPVIGPDMTLLTNDMYPPSVQAAEGWLESVGM